MAISGLAFASHKDAHVVPTQARVRAWSKCSRAVAARTIVGMHSDPNDEMWFDWVSESVMLVAHTKRRPEERVWTAMCQTIRESLERLGELRTLVLTDGGGPTSAQRAELASVSEGKPYRVSVVSGAPGVRFIVSSMALFNPTIQCFQPTDWKKGLRHLMSEPAELSTAVRAVQDLAGRPSADRFKILTSVSAAR